MVSEMEGKQFRDHDSENRGLRRRAAAATSRAEHGSAAAKPCWASLLETDEQNTEHAENANTNMGKCDDYTISPEKLLG